MGAVTPGRLRISWIRALTNKFKKHGFVRSVGILVGGTALGQAIMVLALPILTRLYTPDDFSLLAVYVSMLGICSVVACLRFEIAIPIPENGSDAVNILALALCFTTITALFIGILVFAIPSRILSLVKQPLLGPYLWLLPVGVLFVGFYSALQFWSTRKKSFSMVAKTRISQALAGAGTQVGLGGAGIAPFGLLFGQMISSCAGVIGLGRGLLKDDRIVLQAINPVAMRRLFHEYERFPKYSAFEALANTAGVQLPVIMIAALASGPEAGFLMLAMRAMQAPMGLVGSAVSQVYLSHAPQEYRIGNLGNFTAGILGGLAKTGVGPIACIGIIAPVAFPLIFGAQWQRAGELVAWMTPWSVLQFLTSPVSMTLHITQNQRAAMILQVFGVVLRTGFVLVAFAIMPRRIVEWFALSGLIFYSVYLFIVARIARISLRNLTSALQPSAKMICVWVLGGAIVNCLMMLSNKVL